MVKIMLACSAGMSTSLLVTRMQKAAEERGLGCKNLGNQRNSFNNRICC